MSNSTRDSLKCKRTLAVAGKNYTYFSLEALENAGLKGVSRLPCSLKVLLENLLRFEDDQTVTMDDIKAIATWGDTKNGLSKVFYSLTLF